MTSLGLFLLILPLLVISSGEEVQEVSLDVSEVIETANAGMSSSVFQHGDIRRNLDRNADPCVASGCKWPKTGRYVYVPVSISSAYSAEESNIIIRSLLTFHSSTCIRFVWKHSSHRNYVHFYSGTGCWSYLGRQSRGQPISLKNKGCLYLGTVQHEVLHALGFHHEQVRSDRDKYVSIVTENIQRGKESNFEKVATNNLGTPYDFKSVMHYSKYAFSRNGKPTIIAKSNPNLSLGRNTEMSAHDIARVNELYDCCE
ncbi:high choriolytic enzyme 1-like [Antennarius striatus]|uniref:high choriolytic enzyme 1-like n=1 Tax=Antennarius striatus TaxID=241820 RepID=UPI0035AF999D